MPYTLWSRGRLLGESELDYRRAFARHRMGDFHPTDVGSRLMPIATGVSPAGVELSRKIMRTSGRLDDAARNTSEYADFAAAADHCEALALELRAPDGSVIPTEWIDVRDLDFLTSLVIEDDLAMGEGGSEPLGDIDDEFSESWDELLSGADYDGDVFGPEIENDDEWRGSSEGPRYQLQVMLRDDAAIP
jgi:hypothetical protein